MTDYKAQEYQRGFNTGYEDHPDSSVYNDITTDDILTDEWSRGYIQGFNAAKNRNQNHINYLINDTSEDTERMSFLGQACITDKKREKMM